MYIQHSFYLSRLLGFPFSVIVTTNIINLKPTIMKQLIALFALLLSMTVYSQQVMVMFDIETKSQSSFKKAADNWFQAVKSTVGETPDMYSYQVQGSRDMRMLQWFDSKQAMADHMDKMDAAESKIDEKLSKMDPMPEEDWTNFSTTTKFKEASVWESVPELSTMDGWNALSDDEKMDMRYRRIQFFSVDFGQEDAFEAWRKKINEIDKELGVKLHMAVYRSVFGAKGKDYMVILLDKSRFDYHNNWSERMKTRQASEAFKGMTNNGPPGWASVAEENWMRVNEMTY